MAHPPDLLFTGGTVLCLDEAYTQYERGHVLVRDRRIVSVGAEHPLTDGPAPVPARQDGDGRAEAPVPANALQTIDCTGCIVMPGLINCHTHLPMVAFRGMADDLPLMEWLSQHIWPAEAKLLRPQFCYDATLLAAAECIRGGVTCVNDMYIFERDVARALADTGLRGVVGEGIIQYPTPSAKTWQDALRLTEALIAEYAGHPLVEPSVACHAPYSCTPEILQSAHELAVKQGALFHIHLHETQEEPQHIGWLERGETPTAGLARLGLLSPRTLCAHCVWCNSADIGLLAQHRCGVAHDPQSNLKLASGIMPLKEMLAAGVSVGIATDGAASNNNLNLWEELQLAALLAKREDASAVPAQQAIALATREAAKALGRSDDIGTLEAGKLADIAVINLNQPHFAPRYSHTAAPYSLLAYSAQANDVRDVCVEGKLLMRDRHLLTIDLEDATQRVQRLIA